ncbi:hypothetical protein Lepil_2932 [Leptonema illini DSM 21528]|uniref:Uncharacterized protein n=3 Tax=Leptonema illini TaxID=183 RepID=H2CDR1_9LEPT|nr:hypothetical protein Lepil_2932 [Leptonema illini DSM 21528]
MFRRSTVPLTALFVLLTNCVSFYEIKPQKDPSLSMAIFEINVPHTLQLIKLKQKNGMVFESTFKAEYEDSVLENFAVVENIPAGSYHINYIFSRNSGTSTTMGNTVYTSWSEFIVSIDDPGKNYFEVPAGQIVYFGRLLLIPEEKKETALAEVAKQLKTTPMAIQQAIVGSMNLRGKKGTMPVIVLRTDHPAIVGEKGALASERLVLQMIVLKARYEERHPNEIVEWRALANKRIAEITEKIGP